MQRFDKLSPFHYQAPQKRENTCGTTILTIFVFNYRCPAKPDVISQFKYDEKTGFADANLFSMFRFPESTEVHFQCDIGICRGACIESLCDTDYIEPLAQSGGPGNNQQRSLANNIYSSNDEGALMASTTVFVLDPGQMPRKYSLLQKSTLLGIEYTHL